MGGGILLVQYHSLFQLLSSLYTAFQWDKQLSSSKNIWNDEHLANYFVEWLKKQTKTELLNVHTIVKGARVENSSLINQLEIAFPSNTWKNSTFNLNKKSQYMLKECIEILFLTDNSNIELFENFKHPDISNLELDYFIPQHNLAFEYQVNIKK